LPMTPCSDDQRRWLAAPNGHERQMINALFRDLRGPRKRS
jgi:hypothetical protein